jgi:hypothetical protein
VPSWQLTQLVVTPAWVKFAGDHPIVVWQAPQSAVVTMCVAPLPGDVVWQEAHVPVTCVWSVRTAGFQAVIAWHDSQLFVVAMCVAFLPVARTPSWQLTQFEEMAVWSNRAGVHAVTK